MRARMRVKPSTENCRSSVPGEGLLLIIILSAGKQSLRWIRGNSAAFPHSPRGVRRDDKGQSRSTVAMTNLRPFAVFHRELMTALTREFAETFWSPRFCRPLDITLSLVVL